MTAATVVEAEAFREGLGTAGRKLGEEEGARGGIGVARGEAEEEEAAAGSAGGSNVTKATITETRGHQTDTMEETDDREPKF